MESLNVSPIWLAGIAELIPYWLAGVAELPVISYWLARGSWTNPQVAGWNSWTSPLLAGWSSWTNPLLAGRWCLPCALRPGPPPPWRSGAPAGCPSTTKNMLVNIIFFFTVLRKRSYLISPIGSGGNVFPYIGQGSESGHFLFHICRGRAGSVARGGGGTSVWDFFLSGAFRCNCESRSVTGSNRLQYYINFKFFLNCKRNIRINVNT